MRLESLGLATAIRGARSSIAYRSLGRFRLIPGVPFIVAQPKPLIFAWVWHA